MVTLTWRVSSRREQRCRYRRQPAVYGLEPDEGEALWFNGGLQLLKATGDQTEGRFAVMEPRAPKGFASPLHIHRKEDEFFVVLAGEVRVKHGETVIEAVSGSLVYGPRNIPHAFRL